MLSVKTCHPSEYFTVGIPSRAYRGGGLESQNYLRYIFSIFLHRVCTKFLFLKNYNAQKKILPALTLAYKDASVYLYIYLYISYSLTISIDACTWYTSKQVLVYTRILLPELKNYFYKGFYLVYFIFRKCTGILYLFNHCKDTI